MRGLVTRSHMPKHFLLVNIHALDLELTHTGVNHPGWCKDFFAWIFHFSEF
jgi:hypothetical protein